VTTRPSINAGKSSLENAVSQAIGNTKPRKPRGQQDLRLLSEEARQSRRDALSVIHLSRETGIPVEAAAKVRGVSMQTVRWWAADAVGKTQRGRTMPTLHDRLMRLRPIILEGGDGVEFVPTSHSRKADQIASDFAVQYRYIHGDATEDEVRALSGHRAAARLVESDPDRLDRIGSLGGLNVEGVYRELVS
jgi:hypothetical protein